MGNKYTTIQSIGFIEAITPIFFEQKTNDVQKQGRVDFSLTKTSPLAFTCHCRVSEIHILRLSFTVNKESQEKKKLSNIDSKLSGCKSIFYLFTSL